MLVLHVLKHCMGNSQLSHVAYEAMAIATMQQQQQSASQSTSESQSQSQKLMLMQKQKQVKQSSSCSGEWDKTIYHVCNSHEKFMQIERSARRRRLERGGMGRECLSIAGNGSQIVVGEIIISCRSRRRRRRRRSRCRSHILNWDVKLALRRCQSIRQTQCTCCSFS